MVRTILNNDLNRKGMDLTMEVPQSNRISPGKDLIARNFTFLSLDSPSFADMNIISKPFV